MQVFVRFAEDEGRLVPVDLFLPAPPGRGFIDPTVMRQVPVATVTAWVNDPDVIEDIRAHLRAVGPSLRAAAALTSTTWGKEDARTRDALAVVCKGTSYNPGKLPKVLSSGERPRGREAVGVDEIDARLPTPTGKRYDDEFYRAVADVYVGLARVTNSPAVVIADANNIVPTTTRRWIKEARRRGFLPPGHQGKRG